MKKRIVAVLLLVAMIMSMMVACGGKKKSFSSSDVEVPNTGYDGSKVTIKFAHTMGAKLQEVLNYHIGEFNKLYPNITIEHDTYGGWADIAGQINTEIIGDNQPNIAYCYPDHVATYNMSMTTVSMDNLISSTVEIERADGTKEIMGLTQEQIDDFIPGFYNEGKVYGDGKMYTLPMSKSTEVLYYNKTFFEENGLSVPTTWDEMEAVCKKILEIDPKCVPLGYDSEDNMFITMCEQNNYPFTTASGEGKDHFLFNNDQCKSMVKRFREWYQAGYITTESIYGSYTSALFTELSKDVLHSYMCVGSSGGAGYQIPEARAFEVGVAPIPQADPANPKVISQGPSLCILRGGKTTDQQVMASWLFVKYLTTNLAFQTEFSSTSGYMPVIKSAQDNEAYAGWLNRANGYEYLTALVVKVGLEAADGYFTSPAFNGSSVARTEVGKLLSQALAKDSADIDKLFKDAYDECVYMAS